MNDEPPRMSLEEKNKLYNKAIVPICLTLVVFLAYFYYIMEYSYPRSMFDLLLKWVVPFYFTLMSVATASVEVLYYLKVKRPLRFHLRRFGMNMLLISLLGVSFLGLLAFSYTTLTPFIGEGMSFLMGLVMWIMLVAAATYRFQNTLHKYWKEP